LKILTPVKSVCFVEEIGWIPPLGDFEVFLYLDVENLTELMERKVAVACYPVYFSRNLEPQFLKEMWHVSLY